MARFATILLIIGGLNWGLVGFFQFDLVAAIFGGQAAVISRLIYAIVGLAAIYQIFTLPRLRYIDHSRRTDTTEPPRINRAA